jgi:hypothetical protein
MLTGYIPYAYRICGGLGGDRERGVEHAVEEGVGVDALRVVRAGDVRPPGPAEHDHAHARAHQLAELGAGDVGVTAAVATARGVEGAVDLVWGVEAQLGGELGGLRAIPVRKDLVVPVLPLPIHFHVSVPAAANSLSVLWATC